MAADTRWLIRQRQTWYAVVTVPPSLRSKLGRRIKRTLKTRDIAIARARRFKVVAEIKAMIEAARKERQPDPLLGEALAWREGQALIEAGGTAVFTSELPEGETQADFYHLLLGDRVDALLRREDRPADEVAAFHGIATGRLTPLDTFVEQWLAESGTKGALKERTKLERRRTVKMLAAWLSSERIPCTIEAVTRRAAGRFISEHLMASGKHRNTIAKRIRTLANYWSWLRRRGHTPDEGRNPWADQAPPTRPSDGSEQERAFTDAEVALLLAKSPDATLGDFMRVAALTGMRREEIGRLTVEDCQDGMFMVRQGKTAAARRRVPIHSELAALVARRCQGKRPETYLFSELRSDHEERTDPLGKRFTKYRRRLDIQEGEGRRSLINFHSFRRWFNTAAINAGQPPHVVSLVMGHSEGRKGMTLTRYWSGADDDALRAVVEVVKLPPPPAA